VALDARLRAGEAKDGNERLSTAPQSVANIFVFNLHKQWRKKASPMRPPFKKFVTPTGEIFAVHKGMKHRCPQPQPWQCVG
jgi:hypothetical protein